MHKSAPLLYSYMLAPTCFGSSLPSSGSFWIRLSYVKIQIDMVNHQYRVFPGVKRPGRDADHTPPSSAEVYPPSGPVQACNGTASTLTLLLRKDGEANNP
jgi:hypothetical protein